MKTTRQSLRTLALAAGVTYRIEFDAEAPLHWAVWALDDGEPIDIIGAAHTREGAILDAKAQLRAWAQ